MKKIFYLFLILFGTLNTISAQEKKSEDPVSLAKKDTQTIVEYLQLKGTIEDDFYRLFEYKHKQNAKGLSKEEKEKLTLIITKKIEASIKPEQLKKLLEKPSLMEQLTH